MNVVADALSGKSDGSLDPISVGRRLLYREIDQLFDYELQG